MEWKILKVYAPTVKGSEEIRNDEELRQCNLMWDIKSRICKVCDCDENGPN
jgi:hypothetical protein